MFGLFKSPPFHDGLLKELRRTRGCWRGTIELGEVRVPLVMPGSRSAPDPQALAIAGALPASYRESRGLIAAAMLDHFAPYAEAVATGELDAPEEGLPRISAADDVWPHTLVEYAAVVALDGELAVEIGFRVTWDEEHTLGAFLRDGRLIELNGSVLPP